MAIISDAAVEVEGLKVSAANQEVSIPINSYPYPCRRCKFSCVGTFCVVCVAGNIRLIVDGGAIGDEFAEFDRC